MSKLTWEDFVGNEQAVAKLQLLIHEAIGKSTARVPDMVFIGPSGCGKTTLARILADELNRKLLIINSTVISNPFQFGGLVVDLYSNNHHGSIVLLDECHQLPKKMQDNLLTATEHPRHLQMEHKGQTMTFALPENCSFIFATTHSARIKEALLTRLETIELLPYSVKEHMTMVLKYMEKKHSLGSDDLTVPVLMEIAKRARNGRQVVRFCDTIVKYKKKQSIDKLTKEAIQECFKILDVDKYGLTRIDRVMLGHLMKLNTFVGLDTLDAIMPCSKTQIKDQIEPFLLSRGYMMRTASGRMITNKGREAIK